MKDNAANLSLIFIGLETPLCVYGYWVGDPTLITDLRMCLVALLALIVVTIELLSD